MNDLYKLIFGFGLIVVEPYGKQIKLLFKLKFIGLSPTSYFYIPFRLIFILYSVYCLTAFWNATLAVSKFLSAKETDPPNQALSSRALPAEIKSSETSIKEL